MNRAARLPFGFVASLLVGLNLAACGNANPCPRVVTAQRTLPASAVAAASAKPSAAHPIVPCTVTVDKPGSLLADFEKPNAGEAWFSYSDGTAGGVLRQETSTWKDGQRALHVTASGFREWGAGLGVPVGMLAAAQGPCEFDASAYSGVRFRARGRGALRLAVASVPSMPVA
ncbi:MAG TPA: hypothetical protein VFQ35_12085, partial [Polyangiaceae bacterium]|nr:hypothetical protein [Polyangiaceae bacterium]